MENYKKEEKVIKREENRRNGHGKKITHKNRQRWKIIKKGKNDDKM